MISSLASDQIIFATAGYDHTIRFWNPNSGQCYRVLQHNESVNEIVNPCYVDHGSTMYCTPNNTPF